MSSAELHLALPAGMEPHPSLEGIEPSPNPPPRLSADQLSYSRFYQRTPPPSGLEVAGTAVDPPGALELTLQGSRNTNGAQVYSIKVGHMLGRARLTVNYNDTGPQQQIHITPIPNPGP